MKIFLKLYILTVCIFNFQGITSGGCPQPQIKNGRSKLRSSGRRVKYSCRRGFQLYGRRSAWCINDRWTSPPPVCIAAGCPSITNFPNGNVADKYGGAVLIFTCSAGHNMEGKDTLICDGQSWNHDKPICIASVAIKKCDFETEGLCGWKQSKTDDFDWTWHVGTTATGYTGPASDHTLGKDSYDGHYMYIETSSPREEGHQASLLSPLYPPDNSEQCFTFWYHMLGPDEEGQVGALMLYVQTEGTELDSLSPLFYAEGNKGDVWLRGEMFIERTDNPFQIVIVGQKKISYLSDIAIDDVSLGNCSDVTTVPTEIKTNYGRDSFTSASLATIFAEWSSETPVPQTTDVIKGNDLTKQTSKEYETTLKRLVTITPVKQTLSTQTEREFIDNTRGYPEAGSFTSKLQAQYSSKTPGITQQIYTIILKTTEIPTQPAIASPNVKTNVPRKSTIPPMSSHKQENTTILSRRVNQTKPSDRPKKTTIFQKTIITNSTKLLIPMATKIRTTAGMFTRTSDFPTGEQSFSPTLEYTSVINDTGNVSDVFTTTSAYNSIINHTAVKLTTRSSNITESIVENGKERLQNKDKLQPLMIGIGVGIATGLVVIIILVFFWVRNQRLKKAEEGNEELAPITKHGSHASLN